MDPQMASLTRDEEAPIDTRPPPQDLSHHLSRTTKARGASSIKAFYKYFSIPGIGQLAGGLPNNYYFPFDTLEAKVAKPERWQPTPNKPIDPPSDEAGIEERMRRLGLGAVGAQSSPLNQPQERVQVPHTSAQKDPLKKIDLASALQYGTAQGYPPLYYFIRQFTRENLHPNCPYKGGPEVILTCGNTDGFAKTLMALSNEWSEEKDWARDREGLLVEEFCYMNAIQAAKPRGLNVVPVKLDDEGMIVDGKGGLKEVLDGWDAKKGRRPHLMYTVTMGQNPTSGVVSLHRRREIYALCSKYDIIIVEDDPYWYLQYPTATSVNTTNPPTSASLSITNTSFNPSIPLLANGEPRPEGWKSSGFPFLDSLVPSFISIDTDGRVIRLDTFSKTVAPGCRLGWITAQPALVERILRITETSTQQPSGFVQSVIAELLLGPDHSGIESSRDGGKGGLPDGSGWKADGWVRWLEGLRGNYERRMNRMSHILDEHAYLVKSGRRNSLSSSTTEGTSEEEEWSVIEKTLLYTFTWPVGGMFIWLHLSRLSHALWIFWTTKPYRVLVSPGGIFSPTKEIAEMDGWKFFRLCFAAIDEDVVGEITLRLVEGVQGFFRIKDKAVVERLLDDDEKALEGVVGGLEGMAQMLGPC